MAATTVREANVAQARAFVAALNDHVDRCSAKIEDADNRSIALCKQRKIRAVNGVISEASVLREELYDIHRQLDRLHDSFPELRDQPLPTLPT